MGKSTPKTNKTPSTDQIDQYLAGIAAKRSFISASLNMGWQLALTILLPVFLGVKLDDHFHSTPSYTLAALVLAIGGAVLVVTQNVKQVSAKNTQQVNAKKVNEPQASSPSPLSPKTRTTSSATAKTSSAETQLFIKTVSTKKRPA